MLQLGLECLFAKSQSVPNGADTSRDVRQGNKHMDREEAKEFELARSYPPPTSASMISTICGLNYICFDILLESKETDRRYNIIQTDRRDI